MLVGSGSNRHAEEDEMRMFDVVLMLSLASMFVLPFVGVIVFIRWRTKARRALLAAPWRALAERWSGGFADDRVRIARPNWNMGVTLELASIADARLGPYYPDGGTFTVARLDVDPSAGVTLAERRQRVNLEGLRQHVAAAADVPNSATLTVGPREAVIALAGPVGEPAILQAALATLEAIAQAAQQGSPLRLA